MEKTPGFRIHSQIAAAWITLALCVQSHADRLRLHPTNKRYFEINGRAAVLVGSGEHYGAVINTDFNYLRYLDETRACGLNLVRVFSGAYVEKPGKFGIEDNTLVPAPGRFIAPWIRSSTPGAADGGNKFDLTRWDDAWFHRLREFTKAADERGIAVELTFFCPFYDEDLWSASPMNPVNHINGVGSGGSTACHQLTSDLLPYQKALVRKCALELKDHGNVFFEIINEPYQGGVPDEWQHALIAEIVAAEAGFQDKHLIAMNIANGSATVTRPHPAVSILNFHYATPDAARLNQGLNLVIGDDETGLAGSGDFAYRREAWEFMLSGGGLFNHLDFSFTAGREDGLASPNAPGGGGPAIRRQLAVLRWFLDGLPLENCQPQSGFVTSGVPTGGAARAFGVPGTTYAVYLRGGSQANLTVNLPAGTWRGRWINPRSGGVAAPVEEFVHPGGSKTLPSPTYNEDVVLHLTGGSLPPPFVIMTSPIYQSVVPRNSPFTLSADATLINGTLEGVEFFDRGVSLGMVTSPPYQMQISRSEIGSHVFSARAVAADGRWAMSPPAHCRIAGDAVAAVNLNGPGLTIHGQSWLSQEDAVSLGMQFSNAQPTSSGALPLYPAPDPATRLLVDSQLVRPESPSSATLALSHPVSNGTYDVFFTLVEAQTGFARDVRVMMEGQTIARGIGDLALGEWVRYGPYRTTVTDGRLDISLSRETKGSPKISAFSIHQATTRSTAENAYLRADSVPGLTLLSWPASIPADRLQSSTALDPNADWAPLVAPVEDFGEESRVSLPHTEARRFFRLRKE